MKYLLLNTLHAADDIRHALYIMGLSLLLCFCMLLYNGLAFICGVETRVVITDDEELQLEVK